MLRIAQASSDDSMDGKKKVFFVAVDGSPHAAGNKKHPWDLQTALNHPAQVKPGSTIFLRGGTYNGNFVSKLTGAPDAPITVRPFQDEHVKLDGWLPAATTNKEQAVLVVNGAWVVFRDFEVTSSDPRRVLDIPGSNPKVVPGWRGDGVTLFAPNSALINLVIHDTGQGIGFWERAVDSMVYGCVIYNNGWHAPDRGHGHGIYIQNDAGHKLIKDVISFNNFATGMKAYGQSGSTVGVYFDGVVSFNQGASDNLDDPIRYEAILVGTTEYPPDDIKVLNCLFYQPPGVRGGGLRLGYRADGGDVEVRNNYLACGGQNIWLDKWRSATIRDNVIVTTDASGANSVSAYVSFPSSGEDHHYTIDGNRYYDVSTSQTGPRSFSIEGVKNAQGAGRLSFDEWKAAGGWDAGSQFAERAPGNTDVFVRPNEYERGRATIVVYNWSHQKSVDVDVQQVLPVGTNYEVRSAQDYYGAPVLKGTYSGGALRLPLTGFGVAQPFGYGSAPASTSPEFNVFVLVPLNPPES